MTVTEYRVPDAGGLAGVKCTTTADGRPVPVYVEARRLSDVRRGIRSGADGVVYLGPPPLASGASQWPKLEQTLDALGLALADIAKEVLAGSVCTVAVVGNGREVLGIPADRVEASAVHEFHDVEFLAAQIDTIVGTLGERVPPRIALPFVEAARDVDRVRSILPTQVALGAFLDTRMNPVTIRSIVAECDFVYLRPSPTGSALPDGRLSDVSAGEAFRALAAIGAWCWDEDAGLGVPADLFPRPGAAVDSSSASLLIGLGVTELSATSDSIAPLLDHVKHVAVADAVSGAAAALKTFSTDLQSQW